MSIQANILCRVCRSPIEKGRIDVLGFGCNTCAKCALHLESAANPKPPQKTSTPTPLNSSFEENLRWPRLGFENGAMDTDGNPTGPLTKKLPAEKEYRVIINSASDTYGGINPRQVKSKFLVRSRVIKISSDVDDQDSLLITEPSALTSRALIGAMVWS